MVIFWLAAAVGLGLAASSQAAGERMNGKPNPEVGKKTDDKVLSRLNYSAFAQRIKPPVMTEKQARKEIPVSLRLQSHSLQHKKGILQYPSGG